MDGQELVRFSITAALGEADAKVGTVARQARPGIAASTQPRGWEVFVIHVSYDEPAGWFANAIDAVVYAGQLAGWPVEECRWDEVGDPSVWGPLEANPLLGLVTP